MRTLPYPNSPWTWTPLHPLRSNSGYALTVQVPERLKDGIPDVETYLELLAEKLDWMEETAEKPVWLQNYIADSLGTRFLPWGFVDGMRLRDVLRGGLETRIREMIEANPDMGFPAKPVNDPLLLSDVADSLTDPEILEAWEVLRADLEPA